MKINKWFLLLLSLSIGVSYAYTITYPRVLPDWIIWLPNLGEVIDNIWKNCWNNNYVQWINLDGSLICNNILNIWGMWISSIQNNYTKIWKWNYKNYLYNILTDCGSGRYLRWFDNQKKMICVDNTWIETTVWMNLVPMSSDWISIVYPSSWVWTEKYTEFLKNVVKNLCETNQAITWFNTNGVKLWCVNMNCADIDWTPSPSTVCSWESFTQTSNCWRTREMLWIKTVENISSSINTARDAWWVVSYTSLVYPKKITFVFRVFAEDLEYKIYCYDFDWKLIKKFWPWPWKDTSNDIDKFSSSCTANQIYIQVVEWWDDGSDIIWYELNWNVTCN